MMYPIVKLCSFVTQSASNIQLISHFSFLNPQIRKIVLGSVLLAKKKEHKKGYQVELRASWELCLIDPSKIQHWIGYEDLRCL